MIDRRKFIGSMTGLALASCTPRTDTAPSRISESVDPADRQIIEQEIAARRIRRSNSEIALWA